MPELSWRHHAIIQALLSRGPVKEEEFHKIFQGISGKNPGTHQQLFNDILKKINKELSYIQFELRGCRNQYDGEVYYGVVNNVADEQSKLGTKYTVPQIAFYKGVIEAIVHDITARGSISNIEALNTKLESQVITGTGSQSQGGSQHVPPAFKNFTMSQKERTLDELVRDQWLCSTPDGDIGLGVRSFLDLRSWFRNNEVPSCEVCNEAGVKADLCQNEDCSVRIHHYCLKKKFSQKKASKVCPGCGTQWQCPVFKPEPSEEVAEPDAPTQSQPLAGRPRKRLRADKTVDTDADTNGSGPSQISVRTTRSSARLRGP